MYLTEERTYSTAEVRGLASRLMIGGVTSFNSWLLGQKEKAFNEGVRACHEDHVESKEIINPYSKEENR